MQSDGLYDNNYVKAASIFQYCAQFCKKHGISLKLDGKKEAAEYFTDKAFEVEQQFLSDLGLANLENVVASDASIKEQNASLQQSKDKINSYKAELNDLREHTKEQLSYIEDLTIEDIETRSEIVEQIYEYSSECFVNHETKQGLLQRLIADCHEQLGNPPEGCDHSIIGLGSLALGTMTPWSDLEFAVLINKDKPEYKEYFRNLTKLLWIKVINFGETPLSAVGVESLNNYKTGNEVDNWFSDNVIEKAFRFDPVYEDACKSALGRQGKYRIIEKIKDEETGVETGEILTIEKPDYELILTPEEMFKFQLDAENVEDNTTAKEFEEYKLEISEESYRSENTNKSPNWFSTDRHLVQTLQSVALIEGSQKLLDQYRQNLNEQIDRALQQDRALQILQEDVDKFSLKLGDKEEGKLLDVKQNIYRLGDRIINALANYYNITAETGESQITVWQMIDRMQDKSVLNEKTAEYLKEAISIATELRMRTYSENQGRYDNMSTYIPEVGHLNEGQRKALIEKTFHVKDTSMLHHFYHVMWAVQDITEIFCNDKFLDVRTSIFNRLSDTLAENQSENNNYHGIKGMICARFLEYDKVFEYLEEAHKKKPDDVAILENLRSLCHKNGKIDRELEVAEILFESYKEKHLHNLSHPNIANIYNNLGGAYHGRGLYDQAIEEYNKALQIRLKVYESTPNHPSIAATYNNLGVVYADKGLHDQAIAKYKKALEIYLKVYESTSNHPSIADSYNNLGEVKRQAGLYDQAIDYFNDALEIYLKAYEGIPNHPYIAMIYDKLGLAYGDKGSHDQAIEEHNKALKIRLKAYESMPNHPDIARSYNNLGIVHSKKGLYDKALEHYKNALEIFLKAYESAPNHPDIARSYNNLGEVKRQTGLYDQAIEAYQKALEIRLKAYESTPNHAAIANSYDNLGIVHGDKGSHDQSIEDYKKALEIRLKVYESMPNHSDIAKSYNNLGTAYSDIAKSYNSLRGSCYGQGLYDQAIEAHKKALEIRKKAYESVPDHSYIANSHNNLGEAYVGKGLYKEAIKEHKKALEIRLKAHESLPNHSDIAKSYNNLGGAYTGKGLYDQAIEKYEKALEIYLKVYESAPNYPEMAIIYDKLGSAYYSKALYDKAIDYFNGALKILLKVYESNPNHPDIAISYNNLGITYYNKGEYDSAITCQKALLQLDPELKYGNHYHNLACFRAARGDIKLANEAFIKGAMNQNIKVAPGFYAEYAQFLILNKSNLAAQYHDIDKRITDLLYKAIETDGLSMLGYGIESLHIVVPILKTIIAQDPTKTAKISPKILSYHLLITNPEYIKENDDITAKFLNFIENNDYVKHDKLVLEMIANAHEHLDKYKEADDRTVFDNIKEKYAVPKPNDCQLAGEGDNIDRADE